MTKYSVITITSVKGIYSMFPPQYLYLTATFISKLKAKFKRDGEQKQLYSTRGHNFSHFQCKTDTPASCENFLPGNKDWLISFKHSLTLHRANERKRCKSGGCNDLADYLLQPHCLKIAGPKRFW